MKLGCKLYGCMGFLSLLGFIGVFTDERMFLTFFAFAVDFEYLFVKPDEMMNEYLNKSAAFGFYCGTITMALGTLIYYLFVMHDGAIALKNGLAWGWVVSILVHTIMVVSFSIKERLGAMNDK
ncbi:MAG: DUF3796 domain-containing protein [Lachnospiraceae bacterium]|nr:DUF3796 domain-containing protein [Lachnospiraceae bacterium]